jgi:hypothetical protein
VARISKEQRDQRLLEYESRLAQAKGPLAVLQLFAKARQARVRLGDPPLEVAFAATETDDGPLPAAVWVALRQGDVDASMDALLGVSRTAFVVGEHEELDAGYKLTTIEERRTLPDLDVLLTQLAAFLQIPRDVIAMIAEWGPEDPRTASEIDALLDGRFGGPAAVLAGGSAGAAAAGGSAAGAGPVGAGSAGAADGSPRLEMSADELTAMLQLTPEQGKLLHTLVRQADVTITGD